METKAPLGTMLTFYSYKGGTGRSMAVANAACLLARRTLADSERVLVIDWDLEAPGLHKFFPSTSAENAAPSTPGLIDYFVSLRNKLTAEPELYKQLQLSFGGHRLAQLLPIENYVISDVATGVDLLKAGRLDSSYPKQVSSFQWERFHEEFAEAITAFRQHVLARYRYCIIDSRTGLNDISGICAAILPEKLVAVFTPNEQSLMGALEVVEQAVGYRRASDDFRPLAVFPLPSRIELGEKILRDKWRLRYQHEFEQIFKRIYDLERCDMSDYFNEVQLPQVGYYAYGESIAVLRERGEAISLGRAYQTFVDRLLVANAPWEPRSENQSAPSHEADVIKGGKVYDVVISHNLEDMQFATSLAERLRRYGLKPYLGTSEVLPGEDWVEGIDALIRSAEAVAVLVGGAGRGPWDDSEVAIALEQLAQDPQTRVIPVLLPDAEGVSLPNFLRRRNFVDFRRGLNDDAAFRRLVSGIRGQVVEPRIKLAFQRLDHDYYSHGKSPEERFRIEVSVEEDGRPVGEQILPVTLRITPSGEAEDIRIGDLSGSLARIRRGDLEQFVVDYVKDTIASSVGKSTPEKAGGTIPPVIQRLKTVTFKVAER